MCSTLSIMSGNSLTINYKELMTQARTPFERVSAMNEAFNNPQGDYYNLDLERVRKQVHNIFDEYIETLNALGARPELLGFLEQTHQNVLAAAHFYRDDDEVNLIQVRDGLCDIQVFALGAQHFMGVDGNADMNAVVDGVMTRFVKDEADKLATIAKHAANGITDVYFEGEYPTMVMKSASDQPDAPKGKFLKSASFQDTVFPPVFTKRQQALIDDELVVKDGHWPGVVTVDDNGIAHHLFSDTPMLDIVDDQP